jgi:hypothetical protein
LGNGVYDYFYLENLISVRKENYKACVHFMEQTVNIESEMNTTSNEQLRFRYLSCIFMKDGLLPKSNHLNS